MKQTPKTSSLLEVTPGTVLNGSKTATLSPSISQLAALTTPVSKPTPLPQPSTNPNSILVPAIRPSVGGAKPLSKSYSTNLSRSIRHRWLGTVGNQQNYYYSRKTFEDHNSNQCNNMYLHEQEKTQDSTFRHRLQLALDDYGMLPAQLEYLLKLDKRQSRIFRSWYSHEISLPPVGAFGNADKARVIDLVEKFVSNFEQKTAAFEPDEVDHSNEAMAHSCYVLCCEVENSAKAIIDTATSNRTQSSPITMFPFGYITRPSDLEDLGRQDFFTAFYRPIEGGQCRVVKKATNYEDALECLKVAERVEILNLARQDRDKEVHLRSGKLLNMKSCWDEKKDMWIIGVGYENGSELQKYRQMHERNHPELLIAKQQEQTSSQATADDDDLFGDSLDSSPKASTDLDEGYVASPPQKERFPPVSKPNPEDESSDEEEDQIVDPKLPRRKRFGATNAIAATDSLVVSTPTPRPQRSTQVVKFELIRQDVRSAMEEFGDIGIDDVCVILDIDAVCYANQREDARKFFYQKCNDNTMRNRYISSKLETWAKLVIARDPPVSRHAESLKEDKTTAVPGEVARTFVAPLKPQAYTPKYEEDDYSSSEEPDYIYRKKRTKVTEVDYGKTKQHENVVSKRRSIKDKKLFETLRLERERVAQEKLNLHKQREQQKLEAMDKKRRQRQDQIRKEKMRKNPSLLAQITDDIYAEKPPAKDSLIDMDPTPPKQTPKPTKTTTKKSNSSKTDKITSKTRSKAAPKPLFNQTMFSPVKGKRKIKRPQIFDPLSTTSSDVVIGTGFGCPICGSGMAYDEKKCTKCGADTYYVPGTGAVIGLDRDEALPVTKFAPVPKKAPPRKRKPALKKKVVIQEVDESGSSEGSDFDSSDSSSDDEPAPKRAPRRRAGIQKNWEQQRFMKSFKQLPRNKISREEFIPTQTQDADSDDEEYKAEMKLYRKGLSERKVLQIRERKEVNEYKEECERIEANELFFRQGPQRSEESKRHEEQLNTFIRTKSVSGRLMVNKHCCDAKNCRLCNNYWGSEVTDFDCEVEPESAMPGFRVVKSVTEEPVSRKRRLAEANFVLIYNKKLFAKGEAEGGFEELEELVEEEENAQTNNASSNKRRKR
ncbi:hypothetical protein TrVE_jg9634 [Triparma verrucosa]|uniref:Uncharacterized protein n=1 Tax=Triparma verrucosa TaxID=1606542 RepID=A0A9W7KWF9_9STRA|nr:hypothetical protein TrVE_jg9634 [Triparma verrucosa]